MATSSRGSSEGPRRSRRENDSRRRDKDRDKSARGERRSSRERRDFSGRRNSGAGNNAGRSRSSDGDRRSSARSARRREKDREREKEKKREKERGRHNTDREEEGSLSSSRYRKDSRGGSPKKSARRSLSRERRGERGAAESSRRREGGASRDEGFRKRSRRSNDRGSVAENSRRKSRSASRSRRDSREERALGTAQKKAYRRSRSHSPRKRKRRSRSASRSRSRSRGRGSYRRKTSDARRSAGRKRSSSGERRHSPSRASVSSRSASLSMPSPKNTSDPSRNSQGLPLPPELEGPAFAKLLLQQRDVSVLLGLDNKQLQAMASAAEAKARLSPKDSFFPTTSNRLCLLQGELVNLQRLLEAVVAKTAVRDGEGVLQARLTFVLPLPACDLQLDGQGQDGGSDEDKATPLKRRSELCGANLALSSRRLLKQTGRRERLLELRGEVEQVKQAARAVAAALQRVSDLRDFCNLKYAAPQERGARPELQGGGERRGSAAKAGEGGREQEGSEAAEEEEEEDAEADASRLQAIASLLTPPKPEPVKAGVASVAPNAPVLSDSQKVQMINNSQQELSRLGGLRGLRDSRPQRLQGPAYHKLLLSDLVVSQLFGAECALVGAFQKEYKVLLKLADPPAPPVTERVLVVSGGPSECDKALFAVLEKVYAACLMVGFGDFLVWRMAVSNTCCALICGAGGMRVRQIGASTGCKILLSSRENMAGAHHEGQYVPSAGPERVVTFLGPLESVRGALRQTLPFTHVDPSNSQMIHNTFGVGFKLRMPASVEQMLLLGSPAFQSDPGSESHEGAPSTSVQSVKPLLDPRPVELPGPFHLKFLIPPLLANDLIGDEGRTIEKLALECGCALHVLSPENRLPECDDRILLCSGSPEGQSSALIVVLERLKAVFPNLPLDQVYIKLLLPASACPAIIGPGGQRVREVRDTTGAMISVDKEDKTPLAEKVVSIMGASEAVHQAALAVGAIAQTDPSVSLLMNARYHLLEQQQEQLAEEQALLDAEVLDAVAKGMRQAGSRLGGGVTTEEAVRRLESLKTARGAALGPMGQLQEGGAPNYEQPVSFVGGSLLEHGTSASSSAAAQAAKRAAAALEEKHSDTVGSGADAQQTEEEWQKQRREIAAYAQQKQYGQVFGSAASLVPHQQPPPEEEDEDEDPLLSGLMNEAF